MSSSNGELLFPPHLIACVALARGSVWRNFIFTTPSLQQPSLDQAAFLLMIARMVNCAKCNLNSFRSSLGCSLCACQTLKRYHGSDQDLMDFFFSSRQEMDEFYMKEK